MLRSPDNERTGFVMAHAPPMGGDFHSVGTAQRCAPNVQTARAPLSLAQSQKSTPAISRDSRPTQMCQPQPSRNKQMHVSSYPGRHTPRHLPASQVQDLRTPTRCLPYLVYPLHTSSTRRSGLNRPSRVSAASAKRVFCSSKSTKCAVSAADRGGGDGGRAVGVPTGAASVPPG